MIKTPKQTNTRGSRDKLIKAAFIEIYKNGFQPTGMGAILSRAGLTKGAVYHHFSSKSQLGYCVFDEVITPWVTERWIAPFRCNNDPLPEIKRRMKSLTKLPIRHLSLGCPLNNLIQEVGGVDATFGQRMNELLNEWRSVLAGSLRRGQRCGTVKNKLNTVATAAFIVAAIEGIVGVAKPSRDQKEIKQSIAGFVTYLDTLAPF